MDNMQEAISQLKQFRQELHGAFDHRADAVMELLDALSSTPNAKSVVELSLSHFFRRQYGSVFDAIANFFQASEPGSPVGCTQCWAAADRSRQQFVILGVRANPEPHDAFWLLHTQRSVV